MGSMWDWRRLQRRVFLRDGFRWWVVQVQRFGVLGPAGTTGKILLVNFIFQGFLKGKIPYFCSPFWSLGFEDPEGWKI